MLVKLIGKTPINPFLFYTAKAVCIATWFLPILKWAGIYSFGENSLLITTILATAFAATGLCFYIVSLINLGKSVRVGLPYDGTPLITNGLYGISRNPMYLSFALLQMAVVLYLLHWLAVVMTMYSVLVHHFIILSEEKFCNKQFGEAYQNYKMKTRRYFEVRSFNNGG